MPGASSRTTTARLQGHPVALALAAAAATAAVWFGLASVTGLIFHLMPAAPTIAAAWMIRFAGAAVPSERQLAAVATGASFAGATTILLARQGRPLDEPLFTGLVLGAGIAIAAWLLRRTAAVGPATTETGRT